MDRLAAMETFTAVVESGSISAAAARLGIGQPAVSKSLAGLEAYLGVQLLVRSTRGNSLTEAGRTYLAHARTILDEAEAADAAARGEAANLRGPLRIAGPSIYVSQVILPRLAEFRSAHPDVTFDMVLDDRRVDLIGEGIDLAIRGGSLNDSAIIARRIDSGARIVVAAEDYIARRGKPTHPRDLPGHDLIEYSGWSGRAWEFEKDGVIETIRFDPSLVTSAVEGLRSSICNGLGCAIISERMIQDDTGIPKLVRLLPDWSLPPGEFWLCSPAGRRMSARARAFSDWLDTIIAELPPLQNV